MVASHNLVLAKHLVLVAPRRHGACPLLPLQVNSRFDCPYVGQYSERPIRFHKVMVSMGVTATIYRSYLEC